MPRKASKSKPAAAPISAAKTLAQAQKLLDDRKPAEAVPLLRDVVRQEPGNLQALHSLNWALFQLIFLKPVPETTAEQRRIRDSILSMTEGVQPGGELTISQRARALALFFRGMERLGSVRTRADLEAATA